MATDDSGSKSDNYEDLTDCWLDEADEKELLEKQTECTFMWTTKAGEPFGVIMSYLEADGTFWLTCAEARKRVPAVRRDPRVSLSITSTGAGIGRSTTVSYKGTCEVVTDRETKDWFYPALSKRLRPDPAQAAAFQAFLDSPERVILKVTPTYKLSFDSAKMFARSPEAVES